MRFQGYCSKKRLFLYYYYYLYRRKVPQSQIPNLGPSFYYHFPYILSYLQTFKIGVLVLPPLGYILGRAPSRTLLSRKEQQIFIAAFSRTIQKVLTFLSQKTKRNRKKKKLLFFLTISRRSTQYFQRTRIYSLFPYLLLREILLFQQVKGTSLRRILFYLLVDRTFPSPLQLYYEGSRRSQRRILFPLLYRRLYYRPILYKCS